jgi:hypothetical protein
MSDDRRILTVNAGSGSLHVDCFAWAGDEPTESHDVDWQGAGHDTQAYTAAVDQVWNESIARGSPPLDTA